MDKIIEILSSIHNDVDYLSCTSLIDECILDSFDIITLIAEINEAFGVSVPPEEIIPENFNSAEAIMAMVERI